MKRCDRVRPVRKEKPKLAVNHLGSRKVKLANGQAKRLLIKVLKVEGRCSHPDCNAKAKREMACVTCEQIKADEPFKLKSCHKHFEALQQKIRKHALVKHPVNILGAVVAGLKGEL